MKGQSHSKNEKGKRLKKAWNKANKAVIFVLLLFVKNESMALLGTGYLFVYENMILGFLNANQLLISESKGIICLQNYLLNLSDSTKQISLKIFITKKI